MATHDSAKCAIANEECASGSCASVPLEILQPSFVTLPDHLENGRYVAAAGNRSMLVAIQDEMCKDGCMVRREADSDPHRMEFGKTVLIMSGDQYQPSVKIFPMERAAVWELFPASPADPIGPWQVEIPLDPVLEDREEADPYLSTWHGVELALVSPNGDVSAQAKSVFFTAPHLRQHTVLLYHHLGLGDHIVASGLVRTLAEQYKIVFVVVHQPYIRSFNRLFSDLNNVHPFAVDNEKEIRDKQEDYFQSAGIRMMRVGYHLSADGTDKKIAEGCSFAEVFYMHAGLPYSTRWEKWKLQRVSWREEEILEQAGLVGEYAFLHDDPSRGLYVDRSIVRKGLQVYHPNEGIRLSDVLLDYALLMERASELHLMDSSFALLADHLDLSNVSRKAIHVYARLNPDGSPQVIAHRKLYQQDWELIREPVGVFHYGLFLSHPLDDSAFHLGEQFLDDINPEQIIILSIADYAPLPKGVRVLVHVDNSVVVDSPIATRDPWVRGGCAYTVGDSYMNFGPGGTCEMQVYLSQPFSVGKHSVSVTLRNVHGNGPKITSTFVVLSPREDAEGGEGMHVGAGRGPGSDGLVVPISNGEGMDKLSILEIKRIKIVDSSKLGNVEREYRLLKESLAAHIDLHATEDLYLRLLDVNRRLWEVEDDVRRCEATQDFGPHFVQLARSVYKLNDERGRLKRELNTITRSGLVEEKLYTKY